MQLFDEVMYKIEWVKHQEREKKKEEDEKEKERGLNIYMILYDCNSLFYLSMLWVFDNDRRHWGYVLIEEQWELRHDVGWVRLVFASFRASRADVKLSF